MITNADIPTIAQEAAEATIALIRHLDCPPLFAGGENESRLRAEKRDRAYARAIALQAALVEHTTPGPWLIRYDSPAVIETAEGLPIAVIKDAPYRSVNSAYANAHLIVTAVNHHAELVEALEDCRALLRAVSGLYASDTPTPNDPSHGTATDARALLQATDALLARIQGDQ